VSCKGRKNFNSVFKSKDPTFAINFAIEGFFIEETYFKFYWRKLIRNLKKFCLAVLISFKTSPKQGLAHIISLFSDEKDDR